MGLIFPLNVPKIIRKCHISNEPNLFLYYHVVKLPYVPLSIYAYHMTMHMRDFFSSGAASCKSQQEKNNSTRKNNSIGKHIFRYKMCFLIELFFLVELSFSFWLLHEVSLRYCKWRAYHFYQRKSHYDLSTCPKRTRYRFFKKSMSFLKKI